MNIHDLGERAREMRCDVDDVVPLATPLRESAQLASLSCIPDGYSRIPTHRLHIKVKLSFQLNALAVILKPGIIFEGTGVGCSLIRCVKTHTICTFPLPLMIQCYTIFKLSCLQ